MSWLCSTRVRCPISTAPPRAAWRPGPLLRSRVGSTRTGCATGSVGDVWGVGAYIGGSPYVGGGGRIGSEWKKPDLTAFRAWLQVEWSIVRPSFFAFNGPPPWAQDAPVNIAFGLAYEIPWNF